MQSPKLCLGVGAGEMAFPEISLVPWNTTTDKVQPGYTDKAVVKTEWRLLDFNSERGGRR